MNIVVVPNQFRDLLVYGFWRIFLCINFGQLRKNLSKNTVFNVGISWLLKIKTLSRPYLIGNILQPTFLVSILLAQDILGHH